MDEARLSVPERQAVQLAIAVYNECPYCRAALNRGGLSESGHSGRGHRGGREGRSAGAPRLRSLVSAAWQVLDTRGWLGASELATLEGEGVDRSEVYEVVALIGLKTISNYINHMAHTPVDEAFRK
jgi:alkylhydroperoxidase family enzyme